MLHNKQAQIYKNVRWLQRAWINILMNFYHTEICTMQKTPSDFNLAALFLRFLDTTACERIVCSLLIIFKQYDNSTYCTWTVNRCPPSGSRSEKGKCRTHSSLLYSSRYMNKLLIYWKIKIWAFFLNLMKDWDLGHRLPCFDEKEHIVVCLLLFWGVWCMLKKNVFKKKQTANALPFHLCDSQVPLKVAVSSGKSWGSMSELDVPPMFPSLWARRLPPFTSSTVTPLCGICFFSPSMSSFLPLIVSSSSFSLYLSCILITMETSQLKLPLTFTPSVSGGNGRSLRLDRTSLVFFFSCSLSLSILQKKIPCPLLLLLLISSSVFSLFS